MHKRALIRFLENLPRIEYDLHEGRALFLIRLHIHVEIVYLFQPTGLTLAIDSTVGSFTL